MAFQPLLSLVYDHRGCAEDHVASGYDLSAADAVNVVALLWQPMVRAVRATGYPSADHDGLDAFVESIIENTEGVSWDDLADRVGARWHMMLADDVACFVVEGVRVSSPCTRVRWTFGEVS